jgi:hypothetical protein
LNIYRSYYFGLITVFWKIFPKKGWRWFAIRKQFRDVFELPRIL